jgi:uncharacterized protein YndB with AHSA1/START domain
MPELFARGSVEIKATPDRVWRVLTAPECTRQYMFGTEAVTDWKVGSPLLWQGTHEGKEIVFVQGHILEITPARLLRYTTFGPNMGLEDVPSNYLTVTYELTAIEGGVRLSVSQGDFAGVQNAQKRFEETAAGWPQVLVRVKEISEAL